MVWVGKLAVTINMTTTYASFQRNLPWDAQRRLTLLHSWAVHPQLWFWSTIYARIPERKSVKSDEKCLTSDLGLVMYSTLAGQPYAWWVGIKQVLGARLVYGLTNMNRLWLERLLRPSYSLCTTFFDTRFLKRTVNMSAIMRLVKAGLASLKRMISH